MKFPLQLLLIGISLSLYAQELVFSRLTYSNFALNPSFVHQNSDLGLSAYSSVQEKSGVACQINQFSLCTSKYSNIYGERDVAGFGVYFKEESAPGAGFNSSQISIASSLDFFRIENHKHSLLLGFSAGAVRKRITSNAMSTPEFYPMSCIDTSNFSTSLGRNSMFSVLLPTVSVGTIYCSDRTRDLKCRGSDYKIGIGAEYYFPIIDKTEQLIKHNALFQLNKTVTWFLMVSPGVVSSISKSQMVFQFGSDIHFFNYLSGSISVPDQVTVGFWIQEPTVFTYSLAFHNRFWTAGVNSSVRSGKRKSLEFFIRVSYLKARPARRSCSGPPLH